MGGISFPMLVLVCFCLFLSVLSLLSLFGGGGVRLCWLFCFFVSVVVLRKASLYRLGGEGGSLFSFSFFLLCVFFFLFSLFFRSLFQLIIQHQPSTHVDTPPPPPSHHTPTPHSATALLERHNDHANYLKV